MSKANPKQQQYLNPPGEFAQAFGEPLSRVLDLTTWRDGGDLAALYDTLRQAVAESVEQERRLNDPVRQLLWPRLRDGNRPCAPKNAGVYQLTPEHVAEVHRGLLFNGATECCDGTVQNHDSLLLTVAQIGLALVAYQGSGNTWVQRLYRRDLRAQYDDPLKEAEELLKRRGERPSDEDVEEPRDTLSRLVRRTLMAYAERAALLNLSNAVWRMGHGNPVPNEMLLIAGGEANVLQAAGLDVMRRLICGHRKFVYVVSAPADRLLLTIGNALRPLEFAVVNTLEVQFNRLKLEARADRRDVQAFLSEVGPLVVQGVYRAGPHAPPRVFYAHRDFACEAAALAIADSTLQPYRGFPMLIDLADVVAGNTFDGASFKGSLYDAYAAAGEPTRYLGERETRS